MRNDPHPAREGWIRLTATLPPGATTAADCMHLIHYGHPERYEVTNPRIENNRFKAIYRKKP